MKNVESNNSLFYVYILSCSDYFTSYSYETFKKPHKLRICLGFVFFAEIEKILRKYYK